MKNKSLVWFISLFAVVVTGLTVISCNKKFDEPPTFIEPNITANTTIKDLKALHAFGAFEPISTDKIVEGIVVADDRSGNFYKSIVIQDASGGITIRLDGTSLFTTYPTGRKIFIKLKGLYLGDYNGLIQIGGGVDDSDPSRPSLAPLASNLFDTYIVKGSVGNTVTPKVVSFSDLTTNMQNPLQSTLIQLDNFEFLPADTSKVYAPPQVTVNFSIRNCDGKTIVMRNSGYANFAGFNLPNGNGSVVAVYTIFGSTPQLFIRDTSDVKFNGVRCNGGTSGTNLTIKTIQEIRTLTTVPAATGIEGIIVSDTKNEAAGNYRIQDASGSGIQLRFTTGGNGNFKLNDKVKVDVSGLAVAPFNGDLQINNVGGAEVTGTGTITPRVATIADIAANINTWASTVVTLSNVSIVGAAPGSTGTNYTITDASGSIVSFVRATLGFTPPASASTFTGYVSVFNGTPQITLRAAADVVAGGTVPPPPTGTSITLGTSPFLINFNSIGSGLPTGVMVYTTATAAAAGAAGTFTPAADIWNHVNAGFKNFASANGQTAVTDSAAQVAAADRALGVRQTSGTDKGVAFVFQVANTTGKSNLKLDFMLQSLDNSSPRVSKWTVDYATGDSPAAFTAATATGTVTTGGSTFSNNAVSVDFGSALNNISGKVWVRIVVLDATTGAGNRASTAIDDVKFSWN